MTDEINIKTKSKKIKLFIILSAVLIVLVTMGAVFIATSKSATAKKVEAQISLGAKYLSDLNYEQAIVAYELAIEIAPKNADAYIGLADVYLAMGDYEKADEVLEKAKGIIDNKEDVKRIEDKQEMGRLDSQKMENVVTEDIVTPIPTVTPTPIATLAPTETPVPSPTVPPEEKKDVLQLKIDSIQVCDEVNYQYRNREGLDAFVQFYSTSVFGKFSWSRELTDDEIVNSRHSAMLYDSEGNWIKELSFFADTYDGSYAGQLPGIKKGKYTYKLILYIGDKEYTDEVAFVLEEDIVFANNTDIEEEESFNEKEKEDQHLELKIDTIELKESIYYEYPNADGATGLLRFDGKSVFGKFSWSRKLTDEEIANSFHSAEIYDAKGRRIETKSCFADTYDGTFAGELPELVAGSYKYRLRIYIWDTEYTCEVPFVLETENAF